MRFTTSILNLLLSALVAADALSFLNLGGSSSAVEEPEPVVGLNPLVYCSREHDSDILVLEEVNLKPNPPVA